MPDITTITQPIKKIKIIKAIDFSKQVFEKAQWVVFNLFETGTLNMISAAPNNYKSWLAFEIAIAISTGAPLFGFFMVNESKKVWIIDEEDRPNGVQQRMSILNKQWAEMPILFSISNEIQLDNSVVDEIIATAKENEVEFIIFDSLRSIHLAEENSATEMQKVLNLLKRISNTGITVLFTHHNRKSGMFRSTGGEESRGSNAINAAIHSQITCEPKKEDGKDYLIIRQPKLKGDRKLEPFKLEINLNKEGDPFLYRGLLGENESHGKLVKKILELVEGDSGMGISLKSLLVAKIGGERTIRNALKEMVEAKSILEKTWGEIKSSTEFIPSLPGVTHNEKFYFPVSNIGQTGGQGS